MAVELVQKSSLRATGSATSESDARPESERSNAEFFHRFAKRLATVAQRHISLRLRHKIEPEELTQSVFRTFYRRLGLGTLEAKDSDKVWGLLVRLVLCKLRNRVVFFQAQRRDVRAERSLDQPDDLGLIGRSRLAGNETAPDEQAAVNEVFEEFLRELNPDDETIFVAHLAGYRSPAISVQVGSSEQTVRRRLQQMERKLRDRLTVVDASIGNLL